MWRDRTSNHRLLKEVVIVHKLEIKCVRQDEICILMSCKKTASICSPYTYTPWWGPHMLSHYKILGAWAVWALTWCHQRAMNKHGRQNKDDLVCEILKKFFFFFFLSIKCIFITHNLTYRFVSWWCNIKRSSCRTLKFA